MKRIAWFTPLPSSAWGLPCHRVELIARLRERYSIDLIVGTSPSSALDGAPPVFSAHDFVWKHVRHPYDLSVYELADSDRHAFVWPYLVRYPGLVLLHEERLHRSRLQMLQAQGRHDAYRAEFRYDHPAANPDVPELGLADLLGPTCDLWPMRRVVVESSRQLVVPSQWTARSLQPEMPSDRIAVVEPAAPPPSSMDGSAPRDAVRQRYGIGRDAVVFAAFGPLSRIHRIDRILAAVARLKDDLPEVHLLLCGQADPAYDSAHDAERLQVTARVTHVDNAEPFSPSECLHAADVAVCLQWPTGRDVMTSWVDAAAAGKPAIVTDRADGVSVPSLDPRDWQVRPVVHPDGYDLEDLEQPACVSIDILDEDHSLVLAMHRLASDASLRSRIGAGAASLWSRRFQLDRQVADFAKVIERVHDTPVSALARSGFPEHLCADGTERGRSLLKPFGADVGIRAGLAPAGGPEVPSQP